MVKTPNQRPYHSLDPEGFRNPTVRPGGDRVGRGHMSMRKDLVSNFRSPPAREKLHNG